MIGQQLCQLDDDDALEEVRVSLKALADLALEGEQGSTARKMYQALAELYMRVSGLKRGGK